MLSAHIALGYTVQMAKQVPRLYEQFQPEHYILHMKPDAQSMRFEGSVTIKGYKRGRPTKRLTLHQKELKISSASITRHQKNEDQTIDIIRINHHGGYDEVRLHTKELLPAGSYSVTLHFSGFITRPMHGIYPCFFKHDGQEKTLIATQFESHHAREAFPCIDEPAAKATFDLTITAPANQTVLANTLVKDKHIENHDQQVVTFVTTPKMSTYLLAFVIGDLHSEEGKTKDGTLVRSWATVAQPQSHLSYATTEAIKVLEFFTDYFKTPFPLPKLDQVALPDFESMAMENWGLITFREVGLLADPINRSLSGEQLITLVISHELSHQWFGNLVTMRWWDDLWLNESFASIMENIAPNALHPDWHQWEEFATSRVLSCSHRDIYKDVQSVAVDVKHPDEIMTLFDPAIVYAKGARLLTMLYDYLGEDTFRAGLAYYFKHHAYSNTSRHDLWQALSHASKQDISHLMTPWLQQSGMPLVRLKRDAKGLHLSQKRFLMDGEDTTSLWPIPLLTDEALTPAIFEGRSLDIPYSQSKPTPILNVHGDGHYVVNYEDPADRDIVQDAIKERSIDSRSRINLLNDMLLLARAGEYSLKTMLMLIAECPQEPRDAVWSLFFRTIGQVHTLTDGHIPSETHLHLYERHLASYWYPKLGWTDKKDDDPNTKHLRATILALSLSGENPDAITYALDLFEKHGKVEKLPAEQRAMIASTAVRFGKKSAIPQLIKEYETGNNPDVQQAITSALCSTRDKKVVAHIIEWGLRLDGPVRHQDIDHWFAYLMRNHYSRTLVWQWLTENWDNLADVFGGGKHMDYFIWYVAGPLSTAEWEKNFRDFFIPKMEEPGLKRNISIALNEIATRVEWRKREEPDLRLYLSDITP